MKTIIDKIKSIIQFIFQPNHKNTNNSESITKDENEHRSIKKIVQYEEGVLTVNANDLCEEVVREKVRELVSNDKIKMIVIRDFLFKPYTPIKSIRDNPHMVCYTRHLHLTKELVGSDDYDEDELLDIGMEIKPIDFLCHMIKEQPMTRVKLDTKLKEESHYEKFRYGQIMLLMESDDSKILLRPYLVDGTERVLNINNNKIIDIL